MGTSSYSLVELLVVFFQFSSFLFQTYKCGLGFQEHERGGVTLMSGEWGVRRRVSERVRRWGGEG